MTMVNLANWSPTDNLEEHYCRYVDSTHAFHVIQILLICMYTYIFHYFIKAFQGTIILTIPLMTLALVVVSVLQILSTIAAFTILLQGSVYREQ